MAMASVAMDSPLRGKVVLITGGRRVGSELAPMLADRGAIIAMTYRFSRAVIEHTIDDVQSRGVEGMAVSANLSDSNQAESAVSEVVTRFGRLDALVYMASIYRRTPLATLDARDV